eukprot:m.194363 g.194363  ORF g.194363 m.194363 type:complete len:88 (-) comp16789_c2_seq2:7433-7696(-)
MLSILVPQPSCCFLTITFSFSVLPEKNFHLFAHLLTLALLFLCFAPSTTRGKYLAAALAFFSVSAPIAIPPSIINAHFGTIHRRTLP